MRLEHLLSGENERNRKEDVENRLVLQVSISNKYAVEKTRQRRSDQVRKDRGKFDSPIAQLVRALH